MFESGQLLQARYQLQQPLGRSLQARQTWLATDLATDLHELVVIKLLVFTEMQWHDLKLFEREAQVLQNLDHPRIPRYRNYFLVDQQADSPFCWWGLVQDYISGRSLQELLEQGHRFSERDVRHIAEEVLPILVHLHELNPLILHRDIKPSNLILDQSQHVWLVDFGAVQDQVAVTGMSFTVVGTVGYAPLEQFWGRAVAASDLYALGATLIHLLTGVAPVNLPHRDLRIDFRDRVSFRSNFISWIETLTEPALEKRFTSAQKARAALERGMHSAITPTRNRIQTVCSSQTKSKGIKPRVVKQTSPRMLTIKKVREHSSGLSNSNLLLAFYLTWFCITCILTPIIGIAFAFIVAFILAYLASLGLIRWQARAIDPEHDTSIQFDAACDRFQVATRSRFSTRRESGVISAIRYLSITSSQVFVTQHTSYTAWVVILRANRNYTVSWGLTEEECIWFVNEVQTWLNAKI